MAIPIAHASAARVHAVLDGRHGLSAAQVNDVVDSLIAAGLATVDPSSDSRLHAAKVSHNNALESEARRTAARLGVTISASGEINPADLAKALGGHDVQSRLRVKSMFAQAGFIA
jgi:hypothetical protein